VRCGPEGYTTPPAFRFPCPFYTYAHKCVADNLALLLGRNDVAQFLMHSRRVRKRSLTVGILAHLWCSTKRFPTAVS
jgi:hypothetical protein